MDNLFLDVGGGLNFSIKLIVAGYLLYIFRNGYRKSALILALAWLSATLSVAFDIVGIHTLNSIFEALFASLLFYGILRVIEEETFYSIPPEFYYVSSVPFVMALYLIGIANFKDTPEWIISIGILYGLSGFYIFLTGTLTASLSEIYHRKATLLAISLMLYGIHVMNYPLLNPVEWFAPIGFILDALFTALSSYSVIQLVRTGRFRELPKRDQKVEKVEIDREILIIDENQYKRIKEAMRDFNILAFLRNISDVPEKWEVYFVTKMNFATKKGIKTVFPTNLAKIAELINKYLRDASTVNRQGIVIIDCLEFLTLYNGIEPIMKFLSSLRDFAILYNGSLVLVTNPSAWNKREWTLLRKLLE